MGLSIHPFLNLIASLGFSFFPSSSTSAHIEKDNEMRKSKKISQEPTLEGKGLWFLVS